MRRETVFVASMMILGLLLGFVISNILGAIAVPLYDNMPLTLAEKASFDALSAKFLAASDTLDIQITVAFSAVAAVAFIFMLALNPAITPAQTAFGMALTIAAGSGLLLLNEASKGMPNLPAIALGSLAIAVVAAILSLRHRPSSEKKPGAPYLVKPLAAALSMALFLILLVIAISMIFDTTVRNSSYKAAAISMAAVFSTGILWLAAGECGWGGDFMTFRFTTGDNRSTPMRTAALGMTAGAGALVLALMVRWAFNNYLILVSEVLGRSSEIPLRGITLITNALIFMLFMALGIAGGLIAALAPVNMDPGGRRKRLILPGAMLAALVAVMAWTYADAAKRYDLGKDFNQAAGISNAPAPSRTIIWLSEGMPAVREWPMAAEGSGFITSARMGVTPENIAKARAYLDARKDGSVYNYAVLDLINKSYNMLWDIDNDLAWKARISGETLLARLILLRRLRDMPVTERNIGYLRSFTDETKWHIPGRQALNIAIAFKHFGLRDEASAWAAKAGERGADMSRAAAFINEPDMTNGAVRGRITLMGMPPADAQVALLAQTGMANDYTPDLNRRLLDVRRTGPRGEFEFTDLGIGNYTLAVMTGSETVPYDAPEGRYRILNSPGTIVINAKSPSKDTGTIAVIAQ